MGLKIIRICDTCHREFEQDWDHLIRENQTGFAQLTVTTLVPWQCSDCIVAEERERIKSNSLLRQEREA